MVTELIMELTGESRDTQVQPPLGVWVTYFKIDLDEPPNLTLRNLAAGVDDERPVVKHDHNWTIEIPEAACTRPAIIRFKRLGVDHYAYEVLEENHPDFGHCKWLIENYPDRHRTKGRFWRCL